MPESRLPWWLVLLLAVCVLAMTAWSSPVGKRELRWGAGLLTLVYFVLLFQALGGDSRGVATSTGSPRLSVVMDWRVIVCGALSLVSALMLLGQPAQSGQWLWFATLTLANAGLCSIWGATAVAWLLLGLAVVVGSFFVRELRRNRQPEWRDVLPIVNAVPREEAWSSTVMVGATGFLLSLLLIGTIGYALRVETSRVTASHRFSAMPSVERVSSVLVGVSDAKRPTITDPWELVFGARADVIVLLAVLVFLLLAMGNSARRTDVEFPALTPLDGPRSHPDTAEERPLFSRASAPGDAS